MSEAQPAGRPVVGIDLSATNLQFGVVDAADSITGRCRAKTEADLGRDRVIANVVNGVNEACRAAGVSVDDLGAIGVAAAGAIDIPRGVILNAPNLQWTDMPLRDILHEQLGRPIVLDNDVNGAVWGEYALGAGRDRDDLLGVWVGTGIGGGLVLNGRLYHGAFFTAGEIGNTVILPDSPPGERTVEDCCSRTGMLRAMRRRLDLHPESHIAGLPEDQDTVAGTAMIADAYAHGDQLTGNVVNRGAYLLGVAIANWITVLSLDTVVIGGGIAEALGAPYLDRVRESFRQNVFPKRCQDAALVMTELHADAGLLGAALLAREAISR
ncbi:MAG: ROK family protein [Planctomycetota bacterium]|jgi:glucokinase